MKINIKLVIATILIICFSVITYMYWNFISKLILLVLDSIVLTVIFWAFIVFISIVDYIRNKKKYSKEKINKMLSVFTLGFTLNTIQVLSREVFVFFNFNTYSRFNDLNGFDITSFLIVICVLCSYVYNELALLIENIYIIKNEIE